MIRNLIKRIKFVKLVKNAHNHFRNRHSGNILFTNNNIKVFSLWYKNEIDWLSVEMDIYEDKMNLKNTCRKGCSECCKQLILINPTEYENIKYNIKLLKKDQKAEIREKAKEICNIIKDSGIPMKFSKILTPEEQADINRTYFSYGLKCPLLKDNECILYHARPLVCVTYRNYGNNLDCEKSYNPPFGYPYVCLDVKTTPKMYNYYIPKSQNYRLLAYALTEIL